MPVTSPDNIYFSDTSTPADVNAISSSEATSVQAALALRQRYEFVWANAAARTSQTGMVTGATGYQVDTRTEYIYESATWRLKTPHAEFTATSASTNSATQAFFGTFTLDATNSTSSVMATPGASGQITIADPGIYLISTVLGNPAGTSPPITGRTLLEINPAASFLSFIFRQEGGFVGATSASLSLPNYRVATSNTSIYFSFYWTAATTVTLPSRLRITRIG